MYEDDLWYIADMVDGELKHGYMLITKRHIKTPFDINEEEWIALRDLLPTGKSMLDEANPDGYNLGWNINAVGGQNVDHAHLHLFGRFEDEPLAHKGLRYAFKQPSNKRRDSKA
jgi:histidine triad (HIT) family protein